MVTTCMLEKPNIHPTAIVEEGAVLGSGVVIEPYAIVKQHVVLKDRVVIKAHAYIDGHTTIDEDTTIWPFASIGAQTQDLKFRGEITFVKIGKRCQIREYVTINSSCGEGTSVVVGDDCLIMAYCHVAHNCEVGNQVIMANGAMLAGHVIVEDYVVIGGMTPVHQFCRVGKYAMVGGFSRISHDVPPYTLGAGSPYRLAGLNLVGLKRRGIPLESRTELTKAFKFLYRSGLLLKNALQKIEQECDLKDPHLAHWYHFCTTSQRGLIGIVGCGSEQDRTENPT